MSWRRGSGESLVILDAEKGRRPGRTWRRRSAVTAVALATALIYVASASADYTFAPTEGNSFSGVVATGTVNMTASGCPAPSSPGSAVINWGDGTPTSSGTAAITSCTSPSAGQIQMTVSVSGTHTWVEEGSDSVTATWNFSNVFVGGAAGTAQVADAPLAGTGVSAPAVAEGQPLPAPTRLGRFTDANPFAPASDFTVTIDWGDHTTSGGTAAASAGGFDVLGPAHTYGDEGTKPVTVTISDVTGNDLTITDHVAVSDAPLDATPASGLSAKENTPTGTLTLASFTDANHGSTAGDFTASIDWGDGTSSTGTVTGSGAAGYTVGGSHTYTSVGTHTATVTIADVGGSLATVRALISVADVPPDVSTLPALAVGTATGVLHGQVNPNGAPTTAEFQYGTNPQLTGATATPSEPVATGVGDVPISAALSGLTSGTTYYFRAVATETATGTTKYGAILSFRTTTPPPNIKSTVVLGYLPHHGYLTITKLWVLRVPSGARVGTTTCTGHKCSTHTVKTKRHGRSPRTVKLTRQFRGRRLTKSTKLTIRVTKRGWVGKVFVFSMKHPSTPAVSCLAPGSTKPLAC